MCFPNRRPTYSSCHLRYTMDSDVAQMGSDADDGGVSAQQSGALFFDETIYTTGLTLVRFPRDRVRTFNRADAFIVDLFYNDSDAGDNDVGAAATKTPTADRFAAQLNVNPLQPGRGTDVYTMELRNRVHRTMAIIPKPITVVAPAQRTWPVQPIALDTLRSGVVYEPSDELTPFESAIMLKYYALNAAEPNQTVRILPTLYFEVRSFFGTDARCWFERAEQGADPFVLHDHNHHLVALGPVNAPNDGVENADPVGTCCQLTPDGPTTHLDVIYKRAGPFLRL